METADIAALAAIYAELPALPPLGWPAVHAFEQAHSVVLPEPYRTFVATVTAGGRKCGPPEYGLCPPGEPPADCPSFGRIRLDLPFPLSSEWTWEDGETREGVEVDDVYTRGILPLGTDGCAMYWVLVVTGELRGHIWMVCDAGAAPFGREFGGTTAASGFRGWVEHWHAGEDWWDTD